MARYGTDIYGIGRYGAGVLALVDFDATPFIAKPYNYAAINLSWATPTGDWSKVRLVRNRYGYPIASDDGDILIELLKENAINEYIDKGQTPSNIGLVEGIVYFYSIFVFSIQEEYWIKAGNASSISPKEFDNGNDFFQLLPAVYQTDNYKTLTEANENSDLKNFLSIFETYYDFTKTYAELVKNVYDASTIPVELLPLMLEQFGLQYEPELGVQQTRILLKNASLINKKKGSLQGIKDFVKSFTGWDSEVAANKNIMLNINDSSFEYSVGSWLNIAKATLLQVNYSVITPYESPVLATSGFANSENGSLKVTASSAGDLEFACGKTNPKTKGIPVSPNLSYVFSIFSKAGTTGRKIYADIIWYDRDSVEISRAGEEFKTNTTTLWGTRVEASSTSPENAWFAVPYLRIEGASSGEVHYFDAAQFEQSSEGSTYFADARGIDVILKANRINLLGNPCFEITTTPWVSTNSSVTIDNSLTETATGSVGAAKVAYSGTGSSILLTYDDYIKVIGDEWYTLSGYVRTAFTGTFENDYIGGFDVEWYDASQTLISTEHDDYSNLTEFYKVVSFYRTNNTLYVTLDERTSIVAGENMRLVHFQFNSVDQNGAPVTYNFDGSYQVTAVLENEIQIVITGDNIPLTSGNDLNLQPYIQDLKLDFNRIYSTVLAPTNAVYAKAIFEWTNPAVGQNIWIDSVLFERSSSMGSFFDGSRGFSESTDLLWEGTAAQSRAHYYKNRVAVEKRLIATLPKYLPIGTSFNLILGSPDSL